MVEQDALAEARRGVDVHGEHLAEAALQRQRHGLAPRGPQLVREAVELDGVIALEVEQRLRVRHARGVLHAGAGRVCVVVRARRCGCTERRRIARIMKCLRGAPLGVRQTRDTKHAQAAPELTVPAGGPGVGTGGGGRG